MECDMEVCSESTGGGQSMLMFVPMKPLENPVVISTVLQHLTRSDLINCRLVNLKWAQLSSTTLFYQSQYSKAGQLNFVYTDDPKNPNNLYFLTSKGQQVNLLVNLNILLKSRLTINPSILFPCSHFRFKGGSLLRPDLQSFFKIHCLNLSTLYLSMPLDLDDPVTLPAFRKLLFEDAPNIRCLYIHSVSKDFHHLFKLSDSQRKLGNLKKLKIGHRFPARNFLQQFLDSAPNLKELKCRFWNPGILQLLLERDVAHLVRYFFFCPGYDDWEQVCKFAENVGNLKKIRFCLDSIVSRPETWGSVARAVNAILRSSVGTLENLATFEGISFLPQILPCPPLPEVRSCQFSTTHTILDTQDTPDLAILPHWQRLSYVVPNVTKIRFDITTREEERFQDYFRAPDQISSVTLLELRLDDPDWIQNFAGIFPNVKRLKYQVQENSSLPPACRNIFRYFPGLEHLAFDLCEWHAMEDDEINYYNVAEDNWDFCVEMDSLFTGIDLEVCKKLREDLEFDPDWEFVPGSGDLPSIFDLKHLKVLDMRCWNFRHIRDQICSHVAGIFGFMEMRRRQESFRVLFTGRHSQNILAETKLATILPFIDSLVLRRDEDHLQHYDITD